MRYLILAALPFAVHVPQAVAETNSSSLLSGWSPYVALEAWEASDAVAVKKFDSNWSSGFSPKDGRNTSLLRLRAGIGAEREGWSIGWEARQEASLVANREALEMVRLYKQHTDPTSNSTFNAQVQFESWSAQGLRLAHWFDGPAIAGHTPRLKISAAYYTKPQLREDEVSGSVNYSAGTYKFNAAQTEAYNRYQYPFMQSTPSASGASLSVAMDWPLAESLSFQLKAEDLWSRIQWDNLPVMQRTINSDVTSHDSNGYVDYRPLMNGMNRQVSRTFAIPRSYSGALTYRAGTWSYGAQIERWSGETIPTLSLTHHFGWGNVVANAETRFNTVGLGAELGKFRLMVQSDNLHPDRAKALGLQLSYCSIGN